MKRKDRNNIDIYRRYAGSLCRHWGLVLVSRTHIIIREGLSRDSAGGRSSEGRDTRESGQGKLAQEINEQTGD